MKYTQMLVPLGWLLMPRELPVAVQTCVESFFRTISTDYVWVLGSLSMRFIHKFALLRFYGVSGGSLYSRVDEYVQHYRIPRAGRRRWAL